MAYKDQPANFVNCMQLLVTGTTKSSRILQLSLFLPPRFLSKFKRDKRSGCWVWTGAYGFHPNYRQHRYGQIVVWTPGIGRAGRKLTTAHRFAYQAVFGQIPAELDVDHVCNNKLCVNPAHLRAVTHQDNCLSRDNRGNGYRYKNRYQKAREVQQ